MRPRVKESDVLTEAEVRRLMFTLLILFAVTETACAAGGGLAERLFPSSGIGLKIIGSGLSPSGSSNLSATQNPEDLNTGKALLLSAILPGAGQYSIGCKWKAALFFTIEVAAWTGVIYYYNRGMDKEDEFKKFADQHFYEDEYRGVEFDLARSPQWGDSGAYTGDPLQWIEEPWDVKIHFLPAQGFTHELPTLEERNANRSDDQQFYEMIGKYIHQFGFGWDDRYGDDQGTPWFDGRSPNSEHYMDIRYDSNTYLDWSSLAIQIAMLNHVASALDASFTVRMLKRRAKAEVSFRKVRHNRRDVLAGGLKVTW